MNTRQNAIRIMEAVSRAYTIPTYFEKRVLREIEAVLTEIEKEREFKEEKE